MLSALVIFHARAFTINSTTGSMYVELFHNFIKFWILLFVKSFWSARRHVINPRVPSAGFRALEDDSGKPDRLNKRVGEAS